MVKSTILIQKICLLGGFCNEFEKKELFLKNILTSEDILCIIHEKTNGLDNKQNFRSHLAA